MKHLLALTLVLAASTGFAAPLPTSFAYVLQADAKHKPKSAAVAALRDCGRDWIVLDATYDGDERWTVAELNAIRTAKPDRKVVAYLSIGEAEDYRPYWQKSWDRNGDGKPDQAAPSWLNAENPDWEGNYKVKYWERGWQGIMLPEIDRIMAQGFDGLYLDIVDAFEFYEEVKGKYIDHRANPETGRSFRQDMARWIGGIGQRARQTKKNAMIIPQNAAQLLEFPEYRRLVSGIGVEDLFSNGKKSSKAKEIAYTSGFLKQLLPLQKPILVIDYSRKESVTDAARRSARAAGYVFLNTDRPLKTLGTSP
jgi:cysteinyl-tRNA synthetase, unknown class